MLQVTSTHRVKGGSSAVDSVVVAPVRVVSAESAEPAVTGAMSRTLVLALSVPRVTCSPPRARWRRRWW